MNNKDTLKKKIIELSGEFSQNNHQQNLPGYDSKKPSFIPGINSVPYAARTFDQTEVKAAINSLLDFELTLGKEGELFENELSSYLSTKKTLLVNSGSSANLLALSSLTSHTIKKDRRIMQGDEIITCAAGFPTTVSPIIQNKCVPVFLDNNPETGNIKTEMLQEAFVEGKTKAVMIAHTLGNPFDLSEILNFCKSNNLWLIEDNRDSLGSTYTMKKDNFEQLNINKFIEENEYGYKKLTGSWGDISTQSFYPPHHITMGEGGAVNIIKNLNLKKPLESFRGWGRDCYCPSGKDNTCKKRFCWKLGELPEGYDHKFIYSHIGYNLKPLDMQAAIGRVQLKRINKFANERKLNWNKLRQGLDKFSEYFSFSLPTHSTGWTSNGFSWDNTGNVTDPSWFGFMIRVKENAPFTSAELAAFLDLNKIGSRKLFGGNLVRQPAFINLKKENKNAFRVVGDLSGADSLMNEAIFLGTYPGLTDEMINFEIDIIKKFIDSK